MKITTKSTIEGFGAGQTLGNAFLRFCASHLYWLGESPYAEKRCVQPAFSFSRACTAVSSSSSGFTGGGAGRETLSDTGWIAGCAALGARSLATGAVEPEL